MTVQPLFRQSHSNFGKHYWLKRTMGKMQVSGLIRQKDTAKKKKEKKKKKKKENRKKKPIGNYRNEAPRVKLVISV